MQNILTKLRETWTSEQAPTIVTASTCPASYGQVRAHSRDLPGRDHRQEQAHSRDLLGRDHR